MQAIVQEVYGSPEVLKLKEIEKPVIGDDEVLVRVHAAAVHAGDYFVVKGEPFAVRLASGLLTPKYGVPGYDLAGRVEMVGKNVMSLQPGDEVFGEGHGTCAEYSSAEEGSLAPKPSNLTFEQAAAVPVSALAALHGLRDAGKVQPGQKVLINGASGGVGTFAVQIAKALGAEVTGVCSTGKVDLVRSVGADHVIDYTQEDFTQGDQRYDLILDNVGNHPLSVCRQVLTPEGTLLPNTGHAGMGYIAKAFLSSLVVSQQGSPYLSTPNREDLLILKELIEDGKVKPVIDRTYPLSETPEALAYVGEGHARGKVVIMVADDTDSGED